MTQTRFLAAAVLAAALAQPALAQRGPASVFAETAAPRAFALEIEALGTLQPNEQVALTLNAADRVTAIYFDDGERIEKGKTLLSLAQREQAALVEAAEADVEEARRQFDRVERLAANEAVSQSEMDEARRNLDSARAQLRAVQSRQRDRVLVAPFDGVLGFRQVSVGSYVRPGDVVATLIDDSEMNLDFSVPSTLLRAVSPGTEIVALTADLPGGSFTGAVETIDNAIDPVTRAVRVRAVLPNPDRLLKSGMFVQVTVQADPRTALSIPEEAIEPVGPETFVYVLTQRDGTLVAERRQVRLGARKAGHVEVLEGLEEGDRVVTEGLIRVRDGGQVVLRDKSLLKPDRGTAGSPVGLAGSNPGGGD